MITGLDSAQILNSDTLVFSWVCWVLLATFQRNLLINIAILVRFPCISSMVHSDFICSWAIKAIDVHSTYDNGRSLRRYHLWQYFSGARCSYVHSGYSGVHVSLLDAILLGHLLMISNLYRCFQILTIILVSKNFIYYSYCNRKANRGEMIIQGQPDFRYTL